jgi:hypothetical protein
MHCGALAARRCKTADCRHCDACGGSFVPCAPRCPGFHLNLEARDGCLIEICDECAGAARRRRATRPVAGSAPGATGDPLDDLDARMWPEAYRAAARLLILAAKETA